MGIRTLCLIAVSGAWAFLHMAAAANEQEPERTFELNFSNGLIAEFAKGNPVPVKHGDIEFVDAPFGKAVKIPREGGYLLYAGEKNFPKERGTILLWLKADWAPKDIPAESRQSNGIFCTAKDGKLPELAKKVNGRQLGAVQSGLLNYYWSGEAKEWTCRYRGMEDFTAGVWKCYAFTWDRQKGLAFFLDGLPMLRSPYLDMSKNAGDANGFYLGSAFFAGQTVGFNGTLSKVAIYDGVLSDGQIQSESWKWLPNKIRFEMASHIMTAGAKGIVNVQLHNSSGVGVSRECAFSLRNEAGLELKRHMRSVSLDNGEELCESLELPPLPSGSYTLNVMEEGRPAKSFELFAVDPSPLSASMPMSKTGITKDLLLESIDCASDLGDGKYRDDGHCRVVRGETGSWRESTGGKSLSGFIYRLDSIRSLGKPHWLEIEYPDNAQRQFYVAVLPEKDGRTLGHGTLDTIGVLTGGMHPITNKMRKKRLLFWPDTKSFVVGCYIHTPYPGDCGPALSKISLYEIEGGLPKLEINLPEDTPDRMIGVWQEDPGMPKDIWFNRMDVKGSNSLAFWNEKWSRMASYLHYTGQNLCDMEVFGYFGDACGTMGYSKGWDELGAMLLQREGLGFVLQMQDFPTGGLGRALGLDSLSWTLDNALAKGPAAPERLCGDGKLSVSWKMPLLNPLHPKVQSAYLKIVRDYASRFSSYESFKGISFITTRWSNLFYRDMTEGYDDWSIDAFEGDTGIKLPACAQDGSRLSKRYEWIMSNAKDKWMHWRADRMARFYAEMAKTLRDIAPGREIIILNYADDDDLANWPFAKDLNTVWLERGVDFKQLASIDGFRFAPPSVKPNYERAGLNIKQRHNGMLKNIRYYCFSPELVETQDNAASHAIALIQHGDFETHVNFASEQVKSYFLPPSFDSRCHTSFSIPHPDNQYELEHFAHMLADFNPKVMLNGWWGCPDNGAIDVYQPFYRAFRSIPMIDFKKVPNASDPVQVKYGVLRKKSFWLPDNEYYLLLVNREYYPVQVKIGIDTNASSLLDVIDGASTPINDGILHFKLAPYQVMCLRSGHPLDFKSIEMQVPPEIVDGLKHKLETLKAAFTAMPQEKRKTSGLEEVIGLAEKSMTQKEYSRLHYLFQSAPAITALEDIAH